MSGSPTPATAAPGAAPGTSAAGAPLGSIYDLGYRRYEGRRLGRRHAVSALVRDSLRSCFGIGRSGRAKLIPFGLAGLALLPAVVAIGVVGLAQQLGTGAQAEAISPVRYATYYGLIAQLLFMFAAAQAPELLGRDLRHRVLSLLFSRALRRTDYVIAKVVAVVVALLLVQLVPQLVIFLGRALSSTDVSRAVSADVGSLPAVVGQAALAAVLLASISLAIASFSARRSYATAGIIVAFVLPPLVAGVLRNGASARDAGRVAALVSPSDVLDATNRWLFGLPDSSRIGVDGPASAAIAVAISAIALAVLVVRYRRMPT
ncbi:MAG TPA: ABC transporter permease subunit [Candidatus Limnocylindrales bacterium]|nr:ABC transporter permease subunit [Candidatus Limnocylindrales bacterium]